MSILDGPFCRLRCMV